MKKSIQGRVAKEVIKEISISPTGKRLVIITILIQIPLFWLPYVTQILTCALLGLALSHIKEVK